MKTKNGKECIVIAVILLVSLVWVCSAFAQSGTPDAKIEISKWKVGFIVGVSGGSGTLTYKGKSYPLSIKGLRVGATAGVSAVDLAGNVYNLKDVKDIEGTYSAAQAAIAVVEGVKVWRLENDKKVTMNLKGKQTGLEVAFDIGGMQIKLK